ncbi:MAG: glycosyltransferase [Actinomycetota bacterium]|nr:glycosyltransferase [Actinomycetota bacterium]
MLALIIVPCYNEQARWQPEYWREILEDVSIHVLFVDDGSSDGTWDCIEAACSHPRARSLRLERNVGKGEAVRLGLLAGLDERPDVIGYLDADGAFPSAEVIRLASEAQGMLLREHPSFDAIWSSRVMLAGRDIHRRASRHYIGRLLTTAIYPLHGYDIYDTQSGFKLFRAAGPLRSCLTTPFATRWFPDVEILQRWMRTGGSQLRVWEEPVLGWQDIAGSKVNRKQYVQLLKDLRQVYRGRIRRS